MAEALRTDPRIDEMLRNHADEKPWVAVEFFPPRTEQGVTTLHQRLEKIKRAKPLYADLTWGAGGSTSELTMELTLKTKTQHGLVPNMHLTCTNMPEEKVFNALEQAKNAGIRNLVALRGDPPGPLGSGQQWTAVEGGFNCALDLVRYIRLKYGDLFCLSVSGYPEGHPDRISVVEGGMESLSQMEKQRASVSYDDNGTEIVQVCRDADFDLELEYLKAKVDAGANVILTQMFFDPEVFGHFVAACRAKGITIPIVPGIMCLAAYGGFKRMTKFCKTRVPSQVVERMEQLKDDEKGVQDFGISFGVSMCRRLLELGCPGLHFYTLNLDYVCMGILEVLGLVQQLDPRIDNMIQARDTNSWISVEFFPPRTEQGVLTLHERLEKMKRANPLFVDLTWGSGGSTSELTMELTLKTKTQHGLVPNMHLTCTNMPEEKVLNALEQANLAGIRNLVALRGDPPGPLGGGQQWTAIEGGFSCALDLVKYIRRQYGDFFCLSVSGYPEGHPDKIRVVETGLESLSVTERRRASVSNDEAGNLIIQVCSDADFESELDYLKAKVDAGANIIITQMFLDVEVYGYFVEACRAKGIMVPIVPGIMCLAAYGGFKRMTKFCKTRVPSDVTERMEELKDDEKAIQNFGISFGSRMCRRLLELGCPGLHFYTLNLDYTCMGILDALGFLDAISIDHVIRDQDLAHAT